MNKDSQSARGGLNTNGKHYPVPTSMCPEFSTNCWMESSRYRIGFVKVADRSHPMNKDLSIPKNNRSCKDILQSPAENEEEETVEGVVSLNKMGGTDTCIDIPRTELTSCLLEKPPIGKKVKLCNGSQEGQNAEMRLLQRAEETAYININCVDPLGRSALLMAIDNENLEMVELLIEHRVETKDALLHAISEEFVEAVEVLLEHEETIHKKGEPHSWEALPPDTATFTPDITPLILSAHRDNYEIIKILLDRGATLPMPHDVRCGCDECVTSRMEDSLRHSRSRINAYRALASPSLIALSSKDPILTAFELSWELRRLSFMEHEFKSEYQELRKQCQDFATALLDHTRSSYELEVLLNHDPSGPAFEHGDRMHLNRLKLAIKLRQKKIRCTFQRPAIVGVHMVRGLARIPSKKYGPASPGDSENRHSVSVFLHSLHSRPAFGNRSDHAEAVHQVYMSFRFVLPLFIYAYTRLSETVPAIYIWYGRKRRSFYTTRFYSVRS
nr:transient receptor potential-gamma protein-like [Leptinotarsa decemlineata]